MKILDSHNIPHHEHEHEHKADQTVGERFEEQFLTVMLKQMQKLIK